MALHRLMPMPKFSAIATVNEPVLVTRNTRDFMHLSGLEIQQNG